MTTAVAAIGAAVFRPSAVAGAESSKPLASPGGIKAVVFDTVGTLLDTYGSITRKGAQFIEARGIQTDWIKLLDSWRAEWRQLTDQIAQGTSPWRSADFVYREALDKALLPYEWSAKLSAGDRDRLNHLWYEIDPWPDPKVYELARSSLNLRPDQILMVAAHKYDLTAAKQFGFNVAFLPRPLEFGPNGKVDLKPESNFDLTVPSLVDLDARIA